MSIFVNEDTFDLSLSYVVHKDDNGNIISASVATPSDIGAEVLNCKVKGRDFDTMSKVMEDATIINHITGKPMVRSAVLCRLILTSFFVSWDAKDKKGAPKSITMESVGQVDYKIIRVLARRWLRLTGGKAV